jgi:hypothetical protein
MMVNGKDRLGGEVMRYLCNSLLFAAMLVLVPAQARSQTFIWRFQNFTGWTVKVELYSKRRNHVWPGNGQVWLVPPNRVLYSNPISCLPGEYICYGAWTDARPGSYWGAGPGGAQGCSRCCYHCSGGYSQIIRFDP